MATYQVYNLASTVKGATYDGVEFTLPPGAQFDLTGATVRMVIESGGIHIKTFTTPSQIILTLPYKITLVPVIINFPIGQFDWELVITFTDGRVKKWIKGKWSITD